MVLTKSLQLGLRQSSCLQISTRYAHCWSVSSWGVYRAGRLVRWRHLRRALWTVAIPKLVSVASQRKRGEEYELFSAFQLAKQEFRALFLGGGHVMRRDKIQHGTLDILVEMPCV